MENKTELLATAMNLEEVMNLLSAGVDAIKIGHQKYGLRLPGDFELSDINEACKLANTHNATIYVAINGIFHNDIFDTLGDYLVQLQQFGVKGLICGDPSIFVVAKENDITIPIHWNPETLSTNYETLRYWGTKGVKRVVLANELSIDNVLEINKQLALTVEVQLHGMTCIFQSKRELVSNYYNYIENEKSTKDTSQKSKLFIKEHGKPETNYPIFEDCNGTHIMSDADLCMIEHLDLLLDAKVGSLRIDGLLKSSEYHLNIVKIYREAIDAYYQDPTIYKERKNYYLKRIQEIQPKERKLDTGFYFKEQIY